MLNRNCLLLTFFFACVISACAKKEVVKKPESPPASLLKSDVEFWLTNPDKSQLFKKQNVQINFANILNQNPLIEVDSALTYQSIDGFGFTLTGGSASLINSLPAGQQEDLLKELFAIDSTHIGISYLRISIGASDLSSEPFTYDDMPAGQSDESLQHFSIERERKDLIPVLKKILTIFPGIKIMGSPWSAPTWMKTNNSFVGGSLKAEYYNAYARYFVKYIGAMAAEGIIIDAITPQNEPLHPGNNPSMLMYAADQADFIKNHLGPLFQASGLKTKIIIYDHNADRPDYPISILNDPEANKYVHGSAFHLYGGNINALSQVHDAHPDKAIYFTEQWVGGPGNFKGDLAWHVENLIIGASRNWSRNVLEWNLAADQNYNPHTAGGCTTCLGGITIAPAITRNVAYYIIAHASKFVRPGSVRIGSSLNPDLPNVAFKSPSGKKVLIVFNKTNASKSFNIKYNGRLAGATLNAGAVGTFIW